MPQPETATKAISAIFEAAKQLDASICGISWNGFNLAGDEKSIEEVRRLMHEEGRFKAYRLRVENGNTE